METAESYLILKTLPNEIQVDFEKLWGLHPDDKKSLIIHGSIVKTPRYSSNYGRSYNYSGIKDKALSIPDELVPFLSFANAGNGWKYNQILMNWYENGLHYIGPHSDSIRQLRYGSSIMSISLGESRVFRIRNKATNEITDIPLKDRTVVVMGGKFQQEFTHEIPKITGKKGLNVGRRISLTFRCFS